MPHFRRPFLRNVLETVWTVDGETHENDVCVGVGERPQTIVVFLACAWGERMGRGERGGGRGEGGDGEEGEEGEGGGRGS